MRQVALMRGRLGVGAFRRSWQRLSASGGLFSTNGITSSSQPPRRFEHGDCYRGMGMKDHQRGLMSGSKNGRVGFIGLGNMGSCMATNLLRKGYDVVLFDADRSKATSLAARAGGTTAASLEELAQGTSTVITMLPNTPNVESVYLGSHADSSPCHALLDLVQPDTLVVDSSTIDPIASRRINAAAVARGVTMVDAPVSGGVPAATNAELTFIVGGEEEGMERARPLLMSMGNKVLYCGEAGSGCVAKVCNNLCLAISMIAVSEAMSLGSKMGMDPSVLAGVLNASTARCWSSEVYNPYPAVVEGAPSSRGFEGGFATALMAKDLHIALQAAHANSQSLPMGDLAHQLYSLWCTHGHASKDFSSIFELICAESKSENGSKRPESGGGHQT